MRIVIIDYGMGNLRSVEKAFQRIGVTPKISSEPKEILQADKLVLPGVGHFSKGMKNLKERKLIDILNELVLIKKKQILGICLGMQLMTEFSEEGNCKGLEWIQARAKRFSFENNKLKIPHIGWNNLYIKNNEHLLKNITNDDLFYFVHSFYITCSVSNDILANTIYGFNFVSVFNNNNIFGCQFHPEKSHDKGLEILKNFAFL